jgi:phage gpG-like protein
MAAEFKIDDKEMLDFLNGLNERCKELRDSANRKVTGVLSVIAFRDIMDHFSKQEGSEGPWKQWSDSYRKTVEGKMAFRKFRSGGPTIPFNLDMMSDAQKSHFKPPRKPGNILQATGRLRNSFKPSNVRSSIEGIVWFNNAKTKSGFPYAQAHDDGGETLPKRDFMWLSEKAFDDMLENIQNFMLDEGF